MDMQFYIDLRQLHGVQHFAAIANKRKAYHVVGCVLSVFRLAWSDQLEIVCRQTCVVILCLHPNVQMHALKFFQKVGTDFGIPAARDADSRVIAYKFVQGNSVLLL